MKKITVIKIMGLLYMIVFAGIAFFIYTLYPYVQNLIFVLFTVLVIGVNLYRMRNSKVFDELADVPVILLITNPIAVTLFFVFFTAGIYYGGTAVEHGAEDVFYLVNHGNYTEVSEVIWERMKLLQTITIPVFLINFVLDGIYIVKKKGLKFRSISE